MGKPKKQCIRCGAEKNNNRQGGRLCNYCLEEKDPVWIQIKRERARLHGEKQRRRQGRQPRRQKLNEDGQVWCCRCKQYLDSRRFKKQKNGKWDAMCKPCKSFYHHERRLITVFGIDADEYHRILELQQYGCAICKNKPRSYRLAVDHCHRTGKIRGLLCKRCNHDLLGSAYDSIPILERAISYLEAPPAQTGVRVLIHDETKFQEGLRGNR